MCSYRELMFSKKGCNINFQKKEVPRDLGLLVVTWRLFVPVVAVGVHSFAEDGGSDAYHG